MILIVRIVSVLISVAAFMIVFDVLHGVAGLILSRFSLDKHPWLHRAGIRCLAMSEVFGKKIAPRRCQLDCGTAKCGNWTCSRYDTYER